MKLKTGVKVGRIQPELVLGLVVANTIHQEITGEPLVVTSLADGKHKNTSLHYKGLAADIRSHDLNTAQKTHFSGAMKLALGSEFQLILEDEGKANEHYHLEYDPPKAPK